MNSTAVWRFNTADETEINEIGEINGMLCEKYKLSRVDDGLASTTIQQQMRTFRHFVRWCESVELIEQGTSELIRIPKTNKDEQARDASIEPERARAILSYIEQFEYATLQHLVFGLFWETGMRTGTARALDLEDVRRDNSDVMYVTPKHRPSEDTPLKLGNDGERHITIGRGQFASAIDDWIEHRRPDIEDNYGRKPLLATNRGRAATTTVRVACYKVTHPCFEGSCPHGRVRDDCEYTQHDQSGGCPSAVSPHAVRRAAITYHLDQGMPKELVGERCNVSAGTLDDHYDVRSEEQKRANRTRYIEKMDFE